MRMCFLGCISLAKVFILRVQNFDCDCDFGSRVSFRFLVFLAEC